MQGKVKTGEIVAAGSALLLLVVMFFGWFGITLEDSIELSNKNQEVIAERFSDGTYLAGDLTDKVTFNAWQAFSLIDIFLLLTILVAVGLGVMAAASRSPNVPVAASALTTTFGIFATLLVLFRLIFTPYGLDRELFAFVGLLLTMGITVGGWMAMQEEGVSFRGEGERVAGRRPDSG
ncbi:MAG: hypothetical protein KDB58_11980 [Solirubrobacterales bacterium]|nr:hypothetical protein [Solirubrobacterales bacterium]MCB8970267.1 hypothetical protein [Thermoleophilales bacterium]MCO5325446.1 hypothetical protein [Solirubrobacterales bacterium]